VPSSLEVLFRTQSSDRDKFLARLFGIISEEVVRIWARCDAAPYSDLGRPTLRRRGTEVRATLDFLLAARSGGHLFVAELKCELEYQNYKYLALADPSMLEHHRKPAFELLLQTAADPAQVDVKTSKGPSAVHGAILVWGDATENGRDATIAKYGFADILTVSSMIQDLNRWKSAEWSAFISSRRRWTTELFDGLEALTGA
jgi:hypothetical protein